MNWKRMLVVFACAVLLGGATAKAQSPAPIPPQAQPYGMTYGEWAARWWQWDLALPIEKNPSFDQNGSCANGANGQLGPVWFLTGVINDSGTAVRDCTIPAGKALFFPIINVECSTVEAPPFFGANEEELRACLQNPLFELGAVTAEIDGVPVANLADYFVESPLFSFTLPPDNVLGVPAGAGQSMTTGYWLMLPPLPVGSHVIHFSGTYVQFGFTLDITYNLTVAPRR